MGLHPWEFDRYTLNEFVCKRRGMSNNEIKLWNVARFLAFYSAGPYLKKGTKLTDILPLPGDNTPKRLKDLSGSELKEWYEKRKQAEIAAGIRTVDNGNT